MTAKIEEATNQAFRKLYDLLRTMKMLIKIVALYDTIEKIVKCLHIGKFIVRRFLKMFLSRIVVTVLIPNINAVISSIKTLFNAK